MQLNINTYSLYISDDDKRNIQTDYQRGTEKEKAKFDELSRKKPVNLEDYPLFIAAVLGEDFVRRSGK